MASEAAAKTPQPESPGLSPAPEPPKKRKDQGGGNPLTRPENLRIIGLVLTIALIALVTRINGCDMDRMATKVAALDDVANIKQTVVGSSQAIKNKLEGVAGVQNGHVASTANANSKLDAIIAHSPTVVFKYNPKSGNEPPTGQLRALTDAVTRGASMRVVHSPSRGPGRTAVVECVFVTVDPNGSVNCIGPVVAASTDIADGRRYQETIRHDGTLTISHWNADGGNVQGATLSRERTTSWIATLPFE